MYDYARKRRGLQANGRVNRVFHKDDEVLVEYFTNFSWQPPIDDSEIHHVQTFYDGGWYQRPLGQWHINK